MDELLAKIQNNEAACYLNLGNSDLTQWNFLATPQPLLNTGLLFYAAARPHFDYFFKCIDYLGLEDEKMMDLAEDKIFFRQLKDFSGMYLPHEMVMSEAAKIISHKPSVTLIAAPQFSPGRAIKAHRVIVIDDVNLFGNPEPVWRKIEMQLPKTTSIFLLALGTEKFLIGPRLKLKYGVPVIDLQAEPKPANTVRKKLKSFAKSFVRK